MKNDADKVHPIEAPVTTTKDGKPEYYGDPGPIRNRSCRDVFFLILFIAWWGGIFTIFYFGTVRGDVRRLYTPVDTYGNLCGVNNSGKQFLGWNLTDTSNMPYLYYYNPLDVSSTTRCVASCPNNTIFNVISTGAIRDFLLNKNLSKEVFDTMICDYEIQLDASRITDKSYVQNLAVQYGLGRCTLAVFNSSDVMKRCVPFASQFKEVAKQILDTNSSSAFVNLNQTQLEQARDLLNTSSAGAFFASLKNVNSQSLATKIYADLATNWVTLAICAGTSLGFSFLWILLAQFLAAVLVWTTVVLVVLVSLALAGYSWYLWLVFDNRIPEQYNKLVFFSGIQAVDSVVYSTTTTLVLAIVFSLIFLIITLILIAARKRIQLSIKIIGQASRAVRAMPLIVFFPIWKYIALLVNFAIFVYGVMTLSTASQVLSAEAIGFKNNGTTVNVVGGLNFTIGGNGGNGTGNGTSGGSADKYLQPDYTIVYLQIIYVFNLFWTTNFIIGMGQVTIAGAIASWYWTRDKKFIMPFAVTKSLFRAIIYHMGSVAFGSLIIAIVQLIRWFIKQVEKRCKGKAGMVARCLLKTCDCCLACLERFLKFISRNAYIEVAIYGYSFCKAARTAFGLLIRNAFRAFILDKITDFLLFLAKMLITTANCVLAYYLLTKDAESFTYWGIPFIVVLVLTFFVAGCFVAIFEMAVDTIFLCFLEDEERNDGSAERPYFMEPALRDFAETASKK